MKRYERMNVAVYLTMEQDIITASELFSSFEHKSVEGTDADVFNGASKFIRK